MPFRWRLSYDVLHTTTHLGEGNTAVRAVSAELFEKDLRLLCRQNPIVPAGRSSNELSHRSLSLPIEALLMESSAELIETVLTLSLYCGV